MQPKRLVSNAVSMGAVQLFNLGLPLLWLPYLGRVLGVEQLGQIAFSLAISQIFIVLTDYGFNLSAPKAIALNQNNIKQVTEIWCNITAARLLLSALGLVVLILSASIFEKIGNDLPLILCAYIAVLGNAIYPQWLFQGLERLQVISALQVATRIVILGMIILLVRNKSDIYWATALQSGGSLLGGLISTPFILKAIDTKEIRWPSHFLIARQLIDGWHLFISTASVSIYTTCNAVVLGLLVTPTALGYYHVAERLIRAAQSLYGAVSTALYPYTSKLAAESTESLLTFNSKLLKIFTVFAAFTSLATCYAADYFVTWAFGIEYIPSTEIIQILSLLFVVIVVSNMLGVQTMLPLGMNSTFRNILLAAALLNFLFYAPSAYFFGIKGAAWANVAVELFVTMIMAIVLFRRGFFPPLLHRKSI